MKERWIVGSIYQDKIHPELWTELAKLDPTGIRGTTFRTEGIPTDPTLKRVLNALRESGMNPDASHRSTELLFPLRIERSYDRSDFLAARLLEFEPKRSLIRETQRAFPGGPIKLAAQFVEAKMTIFSLDLGIYGVTEDVKQAIESTRLVGAAFEPVEVIGVRTNGGRGRIWKLGSTMQLPFLSPVCKLVYAGSETDMQPFDGDYSRMVGLHEGFYSPAEKRYRQSDLAPFGEFALARTRERFGWEPTLIAGRSFFDFCQSNKLKMDWIPVRIDPD